METLYEKMARVAPVVRALVAKELSGSGYTQQEIASLLKVSQPAVSQYLRNLRGKGRQNSAIEKEAASLCKKIKTGESADFTRAFDSACESAAHSLE